jgi:4-hydroxy-3-methylbut-2-enyl diphosphate reductase IspH
VLVVGSRNSSNSNRLVEVAREHGADSYLIDDEGQVRDEWLTGKRVVGVTSGASAPEELVERVVEFFQVAADLVAGSVAADQSTRCGANQPPAHWPRTSGSFGPP